mgnify:CR=1 FL=1
MIADRQKARRWLMAVSAVAVLTVVLADVSWRLFGQAEVARGEAEKIPATSSVQLADSEMREKRFDLARNALGNASPEFRN